MKKVLLIGLALLPTAIGGCGANLGNTPEETMKLMADNMRDMKASFETITDDASADAALPQLEKAVTRQRELQKKLDSYSLSPQAADKLLKQLDDNITATTEMAAASVRAQSKAPKKSSEIQAIVAKLPQAKKR